MLMQEQELVKVFVRVVDGKTICICHRRHKKCDSKECTEDEVTRDRFRGWKDTMKRDRFGRSRD